MDAAIWNNFCRNRGRTNMNKLRIAVIGCGRIAEVYASAFEKLKDQCQIVLAVDKHLDRAEVFAGQFPGCISSDKIEIQELRTLLQEWRPDVLHILLPHHLHCEYATVALEMGIPVLCEKPMDISLEAADRMIEAAKRGGTQLGIIFQNRYIDGVQRVRKLIRSGALGKVKGAFSTLNWHRPPSYYECDWKGRYATEGGGVVIDQAIHSIDLVLYMTGLKAVRVQGHTARRVLKTIEVEDEADAAITLENGAVYSFFACNYYTSNSMIRVEIDCENGTALLTFDKMEIRWRDGKEEVILPSTGSTEDVGENYWGTFHEKQIADFYEALREKRTVPWSPEDARRTLEVVLGLYTSARTQSEICL